MKSKFILILSLIIFFTGCKNNSSWEHSAAIVIKGREVKMTMYGSYYDAAEQWDSVEKVLDKIAKTHSSKKILIRVVDNQDEDFKNDKLITGYVIRRIEKYFDQKNIEYEIKDEREK
ncbi:MAG: hypothetical protein ACQEQS_03005 [Thermodesulfobacteriota bacterium]